MKPTNILKATTLAAATLVLLTPAAKAQNPNFAPGDLVLFVQKSGAANTIMLNLGSGANVYRDATSNILNIAGIGTELTSNFGGSWYEDPALFWGVAGVRSASTSTTAQVDGDPGRTIYASQLRGALGTEGSASSSGWTGFGSTDMTTASNGIIQMQNRLETVSSTDRLVEPTSSSFVDDQNPFLNATTPGASFTIFAGSVQGSFGPGSFGTFGGVAAEGALDLYRILATTAPAGTVQIGDDTDLRTGTYEGTFVIDNTGSVSFVAPIPEPTALGLVAAGAALGGILVRRRQRRSAVPA
jgi:hypothetical protein